MNLFWRLFLWTVGLPMVPIMYALQRNEAKPKKNLLVGVTLPGGAGEDAEVKAVLNRYFKDLKQTALLCGCAVLPFLFLRSFAWTMLAWMSWMVAAPLAFQIPFVRCNRALSRLKERRGWEKAEKAAVAAELSAAAEEFRRPSALWFLPPFLLSLIPFYFDRELLWVWTLDAAMIPLFWLCCRFLYRNRSEITGEDSEQNRTLTRIRRYQWGRCWLVLAWETGAFNLLFWLTLDRVWLLMGVILTYSGAVVGTVMGAELRVRRMQERFSAGPGAAPPPDDDSHWLWGMFYDNPNDSRLLMNARTGVGTTVNLARPAGRLLLGLAVLLLLCCPLSGVYLIRMEAAEVRLSMTEEALKAEFFTTRYEIPTNEVESAELLDTLPALRRVMGTSLENAWTGTWSARELGRLSCCLDPRSGPWLLVRKTDGRLLLLGGGAETAEIAAALRNGAARKAA